MNSSRVLLVTVFLLTTGVISGHAALRHYEKLSLDEKIALQVSEQRVAMYDLELLALDRQHRHHQISADNYQWKSTTMVFYIQQESQFQNEILRKPPLTLDLELPEGAANVLRTVGKYSLGISLALLEGVLAGGGNFSP